MIGVEVLGSSEELGGVVVVAAVWSPVLSNVAAAAVCVLGVALVVIGVGYWWLLVSRLSVGVTASVSVSVGLCWEFEVIAIVWWAWC